ncbi:FtsK/SpoIIIE domain-containing protein [Microbacterium alcoholitolerans]|uniref:FtsK/SpoIIIE domain-containing protein n=1 Tax=unclassified Microbacterium TaxID=2609290 RepID=UPI003D181E09
MDATTIVLPAAPADPRRPPLPLLAAIVPVIAGIVLWLVTGSLFALCFAALGPLMLIASFLDGMRSRRKEARRSKLEVDAAWQRAEAERERLHLEEHAAAWRREPDVAACIAEPPLRGHTPLDRSTRVVIGRGRVPSRVRATGGDDERSRSFRERTQQLDDAPISVELGGGVCVRAPAPIAAAVVRAMVAQLCLRFGPAQLGLIGADAERWGLAALPHVDRSRARFVLRLGDTAERADAAICIRTSGEEPPEGITTVLDCAVPVRARVRTPQGTAELAVEALSEQQANTIAATIAERDGGGASVPDALAMSEVEPAPATGLSAAFGHGEHGELVVDLVDDGPHAIVTGMTGTGKSELLTSWVTAIARSHSPEDVSFVLIDFKGGTAFDPVRVLPHVVAVITDLDAEGARRGVGSLTAELRRREAALAQAGARDVRDCASLARLVIVVDEFAALLQEHPDLGAVFTDLAARGRALGMHLILGTQRASGVVRDALAANCPLRLSLRVAEQADSRFVIGSDAAASLPGGPESRGLVFVRRPRDAEALTARVALTTPPDLRAAAQRWSGSTAGASPWLPPLPTRLSVPDDASLGEEVVLGLADEPEKQRQQWITLAGGEGLALIGGPGAGKSTALRALVAQLPDAVVIPADPEGAWDTVAELATGRHGPVLCDDLDHLVAQYPPDYAQQFLSRWEAIVRAPATTVIAVSRVSGPAGRLIDALPNRALLRLASKVEHIAAGGETAAFDPRRAPGRAWMADREVQLCWAPVLDESEAHAVPPRPWHPTGETSAVVTAAVDATVAVLAAAHAGHRVLALDELGQSDAMAPAARTTWAAASTPSIIVGDPEQWRLQWARLQAVRTGGELVIAAENPAELRQLAGVRELPPFAHAHADRAWAVQPGRPPRRVLLG